jgi:hypothetical protein
LEAGGTGPDPEIGLLVASEAARLTEIHDRLDPEGSERLFVEGFGSLVITDGESDVVKARHGALLADGGA